MWHIQMSLIMLITAHHISFLLKSISIIKGSRMGRSD